MPDQQYIQLIQVNQSPTALKTYLEYASLIFPKFHNSRVFHVFFQAEIHIL